MKGFTHYIIFLLVSTCSVIGQAQPNGYHRLVNDGISSSGSIVTYVVQKDRVPVLYVEDLKNSKTYLMPQVSKSETVSDRYIVGHNRIGRICFITDVERGITKEVPDADEVKWFDGYEKLLVYDRRLKVLRICSATGRQLQSFENITYYEASVEKGITLFVQDDLEVNYLSMGNRENNSYRFPLSRRVKASVWDKENESALIFSVARDSFYISSHSEKGNITLFKKSVIDFQNNTITDTLFRSVRLLNNNKIALGIYLNRQDVTDTGTAEIWLGKSKGITPKVTDDKKNALQVAIIDIDKAAWDNMSDFNRWMDYRLDSDYRLYAYEVNELEDFKNQYPDRNLLLYSEDYTQVDKSLRIAGTDNTVFEMPGLKGLLFFNGTNWFRYYRDRKEDKVIPLTLGTDDLFYNANSELYLINNSQTRQPFPVYKKKDVIFHGYYDLWFYNIHTNKFVRRTKGKEENRRYQVTACNYSNHSNTWGWSTLRYLDKYNNLVLSWHNPANNMEGIALFDKLGKTRNILKDSASYTQVLRAQKYITYIKEKASDPPAIYVYDIDKDKERLIYKSNTHDIQAVNVRSRYIKWTNGNGSTSGTVVRYPFNYDPSVKYPAIVNIYEKKSRQEHIYTSPFEKVGSGINYRDYVSRGYFVIEPDIDYMIGMPGYSASNSVQAVLDTLSKKISVDMERLGLIGHSFGGYQTNFIITQTDRFRAAVSSAGVADLTTRYLTYSKEYHKPDMWRMESWQVRMGKSMFDDYAGYLENSPVYHSQKVKTPLLLITGKEDKVVEADQSVAMFLALKRQAKSVNLLLYPEEEHVIMNKENIQDASDKIASWFDHYLKNTEEPKWLNEVDSNLNSLSK